MDGQELGFYEKKKGPGWVSVVCIQYDGWMFDYQFIRELINIGRKNLKGCFTLILCRLYFLPYL